MRLVVQQTCAGMSAVAVPKRKVRARPSGARTTISCTAASGGMRHSRVARARASSLLCEPAIASLATLTTAPLNSSTSYRDAAQATTCA